ncbi:DsbA family protein [Kurthia gibsonii]|uniref:DsbA family protein n=1 Tax=Kurthia gibsonii TaxID=33946 RepID=UPI002DB91306|nr:DsbA family protein [Kurthia gibsonii]MEB7772991.1 DsbA family protein [Kurthia gibsonii]
MNQEELSLIYVWDAYCGWCYGFSKSLKAFHEKHPELSLTILPGGLFMGERKQAMGSLPYIADVNERIHQLTDAIFGEAYQDLAQEGTFVIDSEAVVEKFEDASSTKEAHEKFIQVQQLGIQSYPTLLLKKGEQLFELGGGVMTPEKIEARLMKILSA